MCVCVCFVWICVGGMCAIWGTLQCSYSTNDQVGCIVNKCVCVSCMFGMPVVCTGAMHMSCLCVWCELVMCMYVCVPNSCMYSFVFVCPSILFRVRCLCVPTMCFCMHGLYVHWSGCVPLLCACEF